MLLTDGMKGCGGCHKLGLKTDAEIRELSKGGGRTFGVASCDACHTRHTFSVVEANQPQACQTCHMQGGNHAVRTAWGFLAVRLPMPADNQWAADRATILANPDYAFWYGWSEMRRTLTEILTSAGEMREKHAAEKGKPH
jgi:hypothetical protein